MSKGRLDLCGNALDLERTLAAKVLRLGSILSHPAYEVVNHLT